MALKLVAWLHVVVFRLAAWLVGFGLKAIGKWVLVVVALLGEEVRRYLGLALSGTIIVLMGKLILGLPEMPGKRWAIGIVLLMLAIWAGAVHRALRYTRRNTLMRVKNRQAIKGMAADIAHVRGKVNEGLAKRARGTRAESLWAANRSARQEEQAAADRAAERAEVERERERRDRASDRERVLELEHLGPDHNPFE
jgi:hypothetical protein